MRTYIIKPTETSLGLIGVIVKTPKGHQFRSRVSSHSNCRKFHDTAVAAVPQWARSSYIVKADGLPAALRLTKGYRDGVQWAIEDALNGDIEIIQ